MPTPVLEIRELAVEFKTDTGLTHALRDVSFDVPRGEVTAIVGESGSGKSVTANCIMRLIEKPGRITNGSIRFMPTSGEEFDIVALPKKDPRLLDLRGGHISMVFQEPMTALSPVHNNRRTSRRSDSLPPRRNQAGGLGGSRRDADARGHPTTSSGACGCTRSSSPAACGSGW